MSDLVKDLRMQAEESVNSWPHPSPVRVEDRLEWKAAATLEVAEKRIAELEEKYHYAVVASDHLANENKRLGAALAELIRLKELKDKHGKTDEYLCCQPIAWEQARKAREGK